MKPKQKEKVTKKQYVPSAEFYSQIVDSLKDYSIFTVDKDLNINSWNSGSTNIFQYENDEIIGLPFETIFTEEDKKNKIAQNEIDLAIKNGRSVDVRWHLRKDDSIFFADGLVFPLKDAQDAPIGFVKILRDITARKQSEDSIKKYAKDLEELNEHKEIVLSILSHDLRSPLAGIIQGAEYLKNNFDTLDPKLTKELLNEFYNAAVNELNMLDYLVQWARIKYAAETFVPIKINLKEYTDKVFVILKETAAIKSLKLENKILASYNVFADEKMLLSILQNLISNAINHCNSKGNIILSAKKKENIITISVADNGIGMPKEKLNKLFYPEVQSLTKSIDKKNGAGIGLLLVKGFLEKNGGEIWVESSEGKGTTFFFTLPETKLKKN